MGAADLRLVVFGVLKFNRGVTLVKGVKLKTRRLFPQPQLPIVQSSMVMVDLPDSFLGMKRRITSPNSWATSQTRPEV